MASKFLDWATKNLLCGSGANEDKPAAVEAPPAEASDAAEPAADEPTAEAAPADPAPPAAAVASADAEDLTPPPPVNDTADADADIPSPPLSAIDGPAVPAMSSKWDGGALIEAGELEGLRLLGQGKVRDLYEVDEQTLLIVSTDRISAFDVVMLNGVPGKGKVLNQLTQHWLSLFEKQGLVPHHLITADVAEMPEVCRAHASVLEGRSMLVKKLQMLPVEAVVRGYITGSGFKDYTANGSICGITLPEGLQNCDRLPEPIFTPSTKADYGEHDENISIEKVIEKLGEEQARAVEAKALSLYKAVAEFAAPRGILVADTKMEFGLDAEGQMVIGDECFTPDCSRYWPAEGYEPGKEQDSFDKQYVRNYLTEVKFDKKTPLALPEEVLKKTIEKYTQIFSILTGTEPKL